ncbi:MAG TPA: 3-hydroxyacyl-CoA dehydrogenase family protein [Xanthobacteraceae bacterium]
MTSEDTITKALTFYGSTGKKAIHIRREVKGHVANRFQAALWREAFYLVEQGIASVEDVDTAIAHGPNQALVERRLAAILAADVVGFSRMIGADDIGTLHKLRALRAEIIEPRITEQGGRIFKLMGDGMLAEFPSAVWALRAAIKIQALLKERNANGRWSRAWRSGWQCIRAMSSSRRETCLASPSTWRRGWNRSPSQAASESRRASTKM